MKSAEERSIPHLHGSNLLRAVLIGAMALGANCAVQAEASPQCPAQIAWVPASKIGDLLSQDSGMPEFNPKKQLNQVTYVGRFVMVPQIGVVAGLPQRPPVLISGLDAPTLRIANRVQEVEWRMINAGDKPTRLRVVDEAAGGGQANVVVQCTLPAPKHQAHGKRFAYLRWFWKPPADGHFTYHVAGIKPISGTIRRLKVPLRYGE